MGCQGPARLRPSVPAGGSPSTPARGQGLLRHKTKMTTTLHDMVDQLEQILSVSELLEKHGLEKPISFVKNIQSSSEEARKLMVRLTRHAGRKQPPVSESHWRTLLQDMLTMQQNVYTCLDPDACYEPPPAMEMRDEPVQDFGSLLIFHQTIMESEINPRG
ncbi:NBAS subunit of NRZ tethering complex [Marmota monax]|uniref:NBAS subunit of NRZ tethering complex n=1 Tax=Marmota monax TaxID=9995 RepID=UPI0026F1DA8C|nr:NBAS subunit of NRZ tethering complex [Marmota monax]